MDEEREMTGALNSFDSSFKILPIDLPKPRLQQLLEKVSKQIDTEESSIDIELTRNLNFVAFLYFLLGDCDKSVEYAKKTGEVKVNNINAKVILGHCHVKRSEFYKGKQICDQLEYLRGNKSEMLVAEAEMAYTYSRLGMKLFEKAEKVFEEVLKSKEIKDVPISYVCLWKFGLALTMKRALNIHNIHDFNQSLYQKGRFETVINLFLEIIDIGSSESKLVARACVELGFIIDTIEMDSDDLLEVLPLALRQSNLDSSYYFHKALELCPDDIFVLERCGKYFRYKRELQKSIDLLTQAISIRSTSFAHHHLALSMKKQLERSASTGSRGRGGRRRTPTHTRQPHVRRLFGWQPNEKNSASNQHQADDVLAQSCPAEDWEFHTKPNYSYDRWRNSTLQIGSGRRTQQRRQSKTRFAHRYITTESKVTVQSCQKPDSKLNQSDDGENAIDSMRAGLSNLNVDDPSAPLLQQGGRQHQRSSNGQRQATRGRHRNVGRGSSYSQLLHERRDGNSGKVGSTFYQTPRSSSSSVYSKNSGMIKSPRKSRYLESSQSTSEILHHLQTAYEINGNTAALYDKGLMLRAMKKFDEALDVFKDVMRHENASLMYRANSYEQAAFCLDDMRSETDDQEERESRDYNISIYLRRSIEIAYTIVATIPSLSNCWESVPTLKKLLQGKAKTKETLKELAFVHEKMNCNKEAVGCYKEIIAMDEGKERDIEVMLKIVSNYLLVKDYEEAVVTLDMIMCLPDAIHRVDPQLYLSTYIEGGFHAIKTRDVSIAGLRFGKALDYGKSTSKHTERKEVEYNDPDSDLECPYSFDLYMSCGQAAADRWRSLKDLLSGLGIRVALNSDNIKPGEMEFFGMVETMKVSTHFLIILDGEESYEDPHTKMITDQMIQLAQNQSYSNIVTLREDETVVIPSQLEMFRSVLFHTEREYTQPVELSQDTKERAKELFYKLSTPKC